MKKNIKKEILKRLQATKVGESPKTNPIENPHDIVQIRKSLQLSQQGFSTLLGISQRTLQHWEQGSRNPTTPTRILLRIAQQHPEIFLKYC